MKKEFLLPWLQTFTVFTTILAICAVCRGGTQHPEEWAAKLFVTAMAVTWIVS